MTGGSSSDALHRTVTSSLEEEEGEMKESHGSTDIERPRLTHRDSQQTRAAENLPSVDKPFHCSDTEQNGLSTDSGSTECICEARRRKQTSRVVCASVSLSHPHSTGLVTGGSLQLKSRRPDNGGLFFFFDGNNRPKHVLHLLAFSSLGLPLAIRPHSPARV